MGQQQAQAAMNLAVSLIMSSLDQAGAAGVARSTFFLAFNAQGMPLHVYNQIIDFLQEQGMVKVAHDRIYAVSQTN